MARTLRFHKQGFTLIELLVVVSIIALLISILLPSLKKARLAAYRVACASNLHSVGVGLYGYSSDYNGQMPYILTNDIAHILIAYWSYGEGQADHKQGLGLMYPEYIDNAQAFYCTRTEVAGYEWCNYENEWLKDWEQPGRTCHTGYSPGFYKGMQGKDNFRLADFVKKPVYFDLIYQILLISHEDGFNVLYGDGHVRWYLDNDKMVWDNIPTSGYDYDRYQFVLDLFEANY